MNEDDGTNDPPSYTPSEGESKGGDPCLNVNNDVNDDDVPVAEEEEDDILWQIGRQSLDLSRLAKLYDQGFELAGAANDASEKLSDYELSAGLWSQAVDTFVKAAEIEPDQRKVALLEQQVSMFMTRLSTLKEQLHSKQQADAAAATAAAAAAGAATSAAATSAAHISNAAAVSEMNSKLQSAQFFLEQAMVSDERNDDKESLLLLYEKAAGMYLQLSRMDAGLMDQVTRNSYLKRTSDILDRMEQLKCGTRLSEKERGESKQPATTSPRKNGGGSGSGGSGSGGSGSGGSGSGGGGRRGTPSGARLTDAEKRVVATSSRINGRIYLPWLGSLEAGERFTTSKPYVDPDGLLQLSAKQHKHLKGWARPSEFMGGTSGEPTMIKLISPYTIRQELVTDCSFVSSLCIAASYERRSGKQVRVLLFVVCLLFVCCLLLFVEIFGLDSSLTHVSMYMHLSLSLFLPTLSSSAYHVHHLPTKSQGYTSIQSLWKVHG